MKSYTTFERDGEIWARPDPTQYSPPRRVMDHKKMIHIVDGTIIRVGRKYILFRIEEELATEHDGRAAVCKTV